MKRLFDSLRAAGVLGINRRNAHFIFGFNPRKNYPLVDDKLKTKALAARWKIPVPEHYGTIRAHGELKQNLAKLVEGRDSFVIKPVQGAMGNGVLVVVGRDGDAFVRSSGARLSLVDLRYHISGILSGLYSLGGRADNAMLEYRVQVHPLFERITHKGVPDCRIIVFRGVPVMSMLRLPTRMSDGRANLHQGALAAGVDIAHGETHNAVHLDRVIHAHPDTGEPVRGVRVPWWDDILSMAARSADMTGLGYIGVDVVVDPDRGPLLLELNARPGLSIQIANRAGILPLLERIERLDLTGMDAAARVRLAKELFAENVDTGTHAVPAGPAEGDAAEGGETAAAGAEPDPNATAGAEPDANATADAEADADGEAGDAAGSRRVVRAG